ncbi:hypothetical protein Lal_00028572 [Lupinus albus]|uniref:Uncharacterized protein n=1 Tax=Lupinus albus TaxID=3870 RepID=A0A6A4NFQ0_LUPAL|nr:hypothetical protein Lalb_Chr19g0130001 [Lupinus albus]KAF1884688.1 hypothetical protein Lal_00028572 [Lupinus albus]
MARPLPLTHPLLLQSTSHIGIALLSLLICVTALLMCTSHSRRRRQLSSCYGVFEEEPVIELNNEVVMSGYVQQEEGSLWQKNILMGGKCQLPDFSGVIIYDSNGNVVPSKTPPLLTWK